MKNLTMKQLVNIGIVILSNLIPICAQNLPNQAMNSDLSYYDANKQVFVNIMDNPHDIMYLKGSINLLKQFVYDAENEFRFANSSNVYSFRFDSNKKIIEQCGYHSDKQISYSVKYIDYSKEIQSSSQRFDPMGNLINEEIYFYDNKGSVNKVNIKKWDSSKNVLQKETFYIDPNDGTYKKILFGKDDTENVINFSYNPYSKNEQYLSMENLGENGYKRTFDDGKYKVEYFYDKLFSLLSKREYGLDGNLIKSRDISYYAKYKPKNDFSQNFGENKYNESGTFHYSNNDFLIKYENDYFYNTNRTYENDKNGNVLKSYHPDNSTEPIDEYVYEYDKVGNWIKKTLIYQKKVLRITVREIEYN
jgi:hypothetical protein